MTDEQLEREVVQTVFAGRAPSPDFRPSLNLPDAHIVLDELAKKGFTHRFEPQLEPDLLRAGKVSVVGHGFALHHAGKGIRVEGSASAKEARDLPRLICAKCLEALGLARLVTPVAVAKRT